ncbi:MAG TPA: mechanosensitive ion channel family protein [Cyclobacteriaceae bacterium]
MKEMDKSWEVWVFAIVVLGIASVLTYVIRFVIGRFFRKAAIKLKVDHTRYNFLKNAVGFIVYLIAVIIIFKSIPVLHDYGTTLLTGAGILAAIVGFASQSAFSNIVSGIFLVIFKPFSVGDRIRIGQLYTGDVEDITLRHTVIKDFENRRIVMPNTVISNETIINSTLTDETICIFLDLNISFDSTINTAIKIIQEEGVKHPFCIDNRNREELEKGEHQVVVRVIGFTDFATQLRAYLWSRNPTEGFEMKCDLNKSIKERFDTEGIELPYPHRTIINKTQSTEANENAS